MRICQIAKYLPIQGGVSNRSYWTARALAERGHQVSVVTNAIEAAGDFAVTLRDEDLGDYQPRFEAVGGAVQVFQTAPFQIERLASNPFVTKLAALAIQVIRQQRSEIVVGHYFEPYMVAGYLASRFTGLPLVVRHGGSDLGLLMKSSSLSPLYQEILRDADAVVSVLAERFLAMGVRPERLHPDVHFSLPSHVFNPQAPPLSDEEIGGPRPLDRGRPTIGMYGKVEAHKGCFDLVRALELLRGQGLDFNVLFMSQGPKAEDLRNALAEAGLADRSWITPFVPAWRVPRFVRACTAVCFLERDFPVAVHRPLVPREVLACGTCLVLSEEVAREQAYGPDLVDGGNVLLAADPKDPRALAEVLRPVIEDPGRAHRIGEQGHELSARFEDWPGYAAGFEQLLARCLDGRRPAAAQPAPREPAGPQPGSLIRDAVELLPPWLRSALGDRLEDLLPPFERSLGREDLASKMVVALRFCEYLLERIADGTVAPPAPCLADAVRYQKTRLLLTVDGMDGAVPALPPTSRLPGGNGSRAARPVRESHTRVEAFAHDVTPLFRTSAGKAPPGFSPDVELSEVEEREILVHFRRAPNFTLFETRINRATKDLLDLCDGTRTVSEIAENLSRNRRDLNEQDLQDLEAGVLAALRQLHQKGIVTIH